MEFFYKEVESERKGQKKRLQSDFKRNLKEGKYLI